MTVQTRLLGVALGALVLAGLRVDDALAKKPKASFVATVNSKRLQGSQQGITALYATTSFSVNGATKPRKGITRTVTVNCLGNLGALSLPATMDCYGTYTEAKKHGAKSWQRNNGMSLTIESFDGSRVVGTFHGMLDPAPAQPTDPVVVIERGTFSIVVTQIGV